ncbi:MAG: DNA adenine methylase [Nitrospinae bacterium]|nr:DNA adenine methylase [Nitrospinota bacterium]
MIKSPLRYPGGKSRAVDYLYRFIPQYEELREPFLGGGSFSFYCVQKKPHAQYYASDINYDLYCFWKELKSNKDELIKEILSVKKEYSNGRQLFQELVTKRQHPLSDFQRAVDFFVLNRITFSGVVDSGGYSEQSFKKRFTISSIERLKQAYHVVKHIEFSSKDYTDLLFREGENVFIFLDPPYYSAVKSRLYGKKGGLHIGFDHELFLENLKKCKYKRLMTYDNSEYIKELFRGFYQVEWELQYGMNNYKQQTAQKGKELLIANYDIKKSMEIEMTLYDSEFINTNIVSADRL